jgi:CRISPR-associated protein Csd1
MIMQSLLQAYDRFAADPDYRIDPRGTSSQKISLAIVLEPDGRLTDIQDVREQVGKKRLPRRLQVLGVTKPSGSGLSPCFLWDSTVYLLGVIKDEGKKSRAREAFQEARRRYLEVEAEINVPDFAAVCRFLEWWDPDRAGGYPALVELAGSFGVFQIRGQTSYVHEIPAIRHWWLCRTEGDAERMKAWWQVGSSPNAGPEGWCLITGGFGPLARLHEPKIKRISRRQPSGATIAGFNMDSVESYGWTQAFNAPASKEAVIQYLTALNAMLDGPHWEKHRLVVGSTTAVFWTDRPCATEDIFARFAFQGSSALQQASQDEMLLKKMKAFLKALAKGREAYGELDDDPDRTEYCILGLAAPTPARIAVRFFHRSTLADLLGNLRRHFDDIRITPEFGATAKYPDAEFPSVQQLLDETCPRRRGRADREAIPPLLEAPLLEAIVTGKRYPDALYQAVLRRLAAERHVNYARACVIKGYLVRNLRKEVSMSLDENRTDPAYRLGRLFAALEKTQLDALGPNLNSTIRDRFYSAASATPRAVFPRVLRTYQHHLSNPKLEGGLRVAREKLVQEIVAPLKDFPAHLNLADQGLFALGYYHQMRAFFTKKQTDPARSEN